jgi:hypothetical protein
VSTARQIKNERKQKGHIGQKHKIFCAQFIRDKCYVIAELDATKYGNNRLTELNKILMLIQ